MEKVYVVMRSIPEDRECGPDMVKVFLRFQNAIDFVTLENIEYGKTRNYWKYWVDEWEVE